MTLYDIAAQYRAVDAALDESGGELTPEIESALAALDGALEDKVDAIGGLIREATTETAAYLGEAKRLTDKSNATFNRAKRLKAYLLSQLDAMGRDKVKGRRFSARVATASTPSVTWQGRPEDIPDGFRREFVELDGRAAQAAAKAGTLPEGFAETRTKYLDLQVKLDARRLYTAKLINGGTTR